MTKSKTVFTVCQSAQTEIRVKSSRFIAQLHRAASKEIAESIVTEISEEFALATHNCYAYRIGFGDDCIYRAVDAGEPSGTAGRPILQALEARNVSNAVLVVTRYFGGTKLGIGGLIRAYSSAAFAVIDVAKLQQAVPTVSLECIFSYQYIGKAHSVLQTHNARVVETRYKDEVEMFFSVSENDESNVKKKLLNATRGAIRFLPAREN